MHNKSLMGRTGPVVLFPFQAKLSKTVPFGTTRLHTRLQCGPGGTDLEVFFGMLEILETEKLVIRKEEWLAIIKGEQLEITKGKFT